MTMLVFAFICGLISANWIKLNFDDRFVQLLSDGFDKAKILIQRSVESGWSHYQTRQEQDLPSSNGAILPLRESVASLQSQDPTQK